MTLARLALQRKQRAETVRSYVCGLFHLFPSKKLRIFSKTFRAETKLIIYTHTPTLSEQR